MHHSKHLALGSLLALLSTAAPLDKRDLVVVTAWDVVTATVDVVQTVWVTARNDVAEATSISSVDIAASTSAPAPVSSSIISTSEVLDATVSAPATTTPVETATSFQSIPLLIVSTPEAAPTPASSPPSSPPIAATTPVPAASPSSSSAPSVPTTASTITGLASTGTAYTGDLTYYEVGLGSCGWTSSYNDAIVAVSHVIMDTYNPGNPNNNPLCGREVTIAYGGQSFQAKVVDTCEGCAEGDLDLSLGFFSHVTGGAIEEGRIHGVQWSWTCESGVRREK